VIVLDTDVVSELMRPTPQRAVTGWLRSRPTGVLRTTSITVAEIRYGIARLPAGGRRDVLAAAADEVFADFPDQILPFDGAAAGQYPLVVSRRERLGRPVEGFDAQIAAICRVHGATLATRNTRDFLDTGIELLDPWQAT